MLSLFWLVQTHPDFVCLVLIDRPVPCQNQINFWWNIFKLDMISTGVFSSCVTLMLDMWTGDICMSSLQHVLMRVFDEMVFDGRFLMRWAKPDLIDFYLGNYKRFGCFIPRTIGLLWSLNPKKTPLSATIPARMMWQQTKMKKVNAPRMASCLPWNQASDLLPNVKSSQVVMRQKILKFARFCAPWKAKKYV